MLDSLVGQTKGTLLVLNLAAVATVFGLTFLAELPDKSLFASLLLGTRYRPLYVWVGVAAAFLVQMAVAVTAGQVLVTLLPHRVVEAVVAVLFAAGAVWLLVSSFRKPDRDGADAARQGGPVPSFWRVAGASFAVVFAAEWGDITQITTANLAAHYGNPVSVGIGAVLALWLLAGLAIAVGAKSLNVIPMVWVQRVTATIMLGLAVWAALNAAN
ncbi:MAG TPA: TMEM165/GDT1 family protein [Streptosporangiaceae bacterium]